MSAFFNRTLQGLALLVFSLAPAAQATTTVLETFDYGSSNAALNGLNGGSGFSAPWSASINYSTTNLNFSSISNPGGSLLLNGGNGTNASRTLTAPPVGTDSIYGSFLFQGAGSNFVGDQAAFLFCNGACNNQNAIMSLNTGAGGGSITANSVAGVPYMALFESTTTASTRNWSIWVLTAAQYDNFVAGGLLESDLNNATIGSGATSVTNRFTRTSTTAAINNISLYRFDGPAVYFDRIAFSTTSLGDLTAPEPATLALSGLCLLGVALAAQRKRK